MACETLVHVSVLFESVGSAAHQGNENKKIPLPTLFSVTCPYKQRELEPKKPSIEQISQSERMCSFTKCDLFCDALLICSVCGVGSRGLTSLLDIYFCFSIPLVRL